MKTLFPLALFLLSIPLNAQNYRDYDWRYNPGNGHAYAISHTVDSWADCQAEAESLGGNLATIRSQAENDWLYSELCQDNPVHWIGLSDHIQTDDWRWVSGEPTTYENWAVGEPSGSYGGYEEDFALILGPTTNQPNKWNDGWEGSNHHGIIELNHHPLAGRIFMWQDGGYVADWAPYNEQLLSVSLVQDQACALTVEGQILTWGYGTFDWVHPPEGGFTTGL
jgi:hypothetical protein